MRIRMLKLWANSVRTVEAGQEIDLPEIEARRMIGWGYAEEVETAAEKKTEPESQMLSGAPEKAIKETPSTKTKGKK